MEMGFVEIAAMGCFYHYCFCQEARPAITEGYIQRRTKNEMNEIPKQYFEEKSYIVVEMCECEWWKVLKTDVSVKDDFRESFTYKIPLRQDYIMD